MTTLRATLALPFLLAGEWSTNVGWALYGRRFEASS